ncbi:hypothetical protein [Rheinheimera soli]|uniref:Uncharacterized protein n=1 Tax=Rheinheimera soli TaxID=443616 RepID=A0ABU1VYW9_9GAMM|nr:hypothetical protein [Rheinheimera soli]MDR7120912.1 hypothetical protein [Rheinheimera soli]
MRPVVLAVLSATLMAGAFSAHSSDFDFTFVPIEIGNSVTLSCEGECDKSAEFSRFAAKYKGNYSDDKIVHFVHSAKNRVAFSYSMQEIYSSSQKSASPAPEDLIHTFDGGLDCGPSSNEPWCDPGWSTLPAWEGYLLQVNTAILNAEYQFTVSAEYLASQQLTNKILVGLLTTVPSGLATGAVVNWVARMGGELAAVKYATMSIVGTTISINIDSFTTLDLKEGDIIRVSQGKIQKIRNGVVIHERHLIEPNTTGSAQVGFGGGGGEGYGTGYGSGGGSSGSYCFFRSWGMVITGGGITFWIDYTPCQAGVYEP